MSWNPTGISSSNYYNNLVSLHSLVIILQSSPPSPQPFLYSFTITSILLMGHASCPFNQLTHCFWVSETLSIEKDNLSYTFKNINMNKERLYAKAKKYFRSYCVISVRKVYHVNVWSCRNPWAQIPLLTFWSLHFLSRCLNCSIYTWEMLCSDKLTKKKSRIQHKPQHKAGLMENTHKARK